MPANPTKNHRLPSLLSNSLISLVLPLLVFELDRSAASGSQLRSTALLIVTLAFAAAWPVSMARSRLFAGLPRPWVLVIVVPCGLSALITAVLAFLKLWPVAYNLSGIVSLIIQIVFVVLLFLPRRSESSLGPRASNQQSP
jgi:hypothetical protein